MEVGWAVAVLMAVGVAVFAWDVTEMIVAEGITGVADAPAGVVGEAAGGGVDVEAGAPVAGPI